MQKPGAESVPVPGPAPVPVVGTQPASPAAKVPATEGWADSPQWEEERRNKEG